MPIYEFMCWECDKITEALRSIPERDDPPACACGIRTERIVSAPNIDIWQADRAFPNLSETGDGAMKFRTREDYEVHLKENHIQEIGINAPVKRAHGNKVVTTYGAAKVQPARRSPVS